MTVPKNSIDIHFQEILDFSIEDLKYFELDLTNEPIDLNFAPLELDMEPIDLTFAPLELDIEPFDLSIDPIDLSLDLLCFDPLSK